MFKYILASALFLLVAACTVVTKQRLSTDGATNDSAKAVSALNTDNESRPTSAQVEKLTETSESLGSKDLVDPPSVCRDWLSRLPGATASRVEEVCKQAQNFDSCRSGEGVPIVHFERESRRRSAEKILVFALIHGDEYPSGVVAKEWMQRLLEIDPRNSWRVIPILNPDGMKRKTRMNAAGVDLNRNFPSEDWDQLAHKYWKSKTSSDPRRNPGPGPGSEPETQCAIKHIEDFDPDLIISIHTPYGVLDFDGPKMNFPSFRGLPWVSLGTFPGSLGRYMWTDRKKPVLTIELKQDIKSALDRFDRLQDISGQVALMIKRQQ